MLSIILTIFLIHKVIATRIVYTLSFPCVISLFLMMVTLNIYIGYETLTIINLSYMEYLLYKKLIAI